MVLVFRLFIGVYKAVLLKSRYCLDLVTGFVIFIRWQNSVFGTPPIRESTYRIPNFFALVIGSVIRYVPNRVYSNGKLSYPVGVRLGLVLTKLPTKPTKPLSLSQVVHCLTCRIMGRDTIQLWH